MEQHDYNLLFRWFVGLNMDDAIWNVTVFTKNRERLLDGDIAEAFLQAVLQQARERSLLSNEHFTVEASLSITGVIWQLKGKPDVLPMREYWTSQ